MQCPFLEDMWQDYLLVGVNDDHIQRLLAEGDLSLERVMELALGAVKNMHAIKGACHQVA